MNLLSASRWAAYSARAALPLALALGGCDSGFDRAPTATSVQQFAKFTITPATAVTQALQCSFISQSNMVELLSAQLQLGLPQSIKALSLASSGATRTSTDNATSTTSATQTGGGATTSTGATTTTSTTATNNGTTTTLTTTSQQGPDTLPPSLLPAATAPNAPALTAPGGAIQVDPLLAYTAATAIYQEVQLLEAYVRDAAQRYVPYIARVQVSVVSALPSGCRLPVTDRNHPRIG
jgi:hypothetical protein